MRTHTINPALNPITGKFESGYSSGAPSYTPLLKEDFSSGTIGAQYSTWNSKSVYANDQPGVTGRSLKMTLDANSQANLDGSICGGNHFFGGRSTLPVEIPVGKKIWVRWKRYIPSTFTWGFCYAGADSAAASACSKSADGNTWLKDLVFSPKVGTARIYIQPKVQRRIATQSAGNRIISENGPIYSDQASVAYPLNQWFDHQVCVFVNDTGAGFIYEWIDGVLVNQVSGANVSSGNSLNDFGIGDYWNGVPYTNTGVTLAMWARELIICTDIAGYGAPTGSDSGGRAIIDPSTTVADFS